MFPGLRGTTVTGGKIRMTLLIDFLESPVTELHIPVTAAGHISQFITD